MSSETAKIRIKIGQLELEYEGQESFLKDELFNLMQKMFGFYIEHKAKIPTDPTLTNTNGAASTGSFGGLDQSTNTIATHLNVKKGPDLAIAAAANLAFVQGKDKFTRKEISDEMQGAVTFFNANMTKNLSNILGSLVKSKQLNLVSKDTYALSVTERKALEKRLAQ